MSVVSYLLLSYRVVLKSVLPSPPGHYQQQKWFLGHEPGLGPWLSLGHGARDPFRNLPPECPSFICLRLVICQEDEHMV